MKYRKLKAAISSLIIGLLIYVIGSFMVVMLIYEGMFTKKEADEHSVFMTYEDIEKYYVSEEISFSSEGFSLYGRLYAPDDRERLVIITHGKDNSGEGMLAEAKYFLDNGFSVMVYDLTGHGQSEGSSQIGLYRPVTDIGNAIAYAEDKGYEQIYLYGVGMGGYASALIASEHECIKAVAVIGAFNSVSNITLQYATEGMGVLGYLEYPIMMLYQQLVFRSALDYSVVDEINGVDIPFVVVNGWADEKVIYEKSSVMHSKSEIKNPDVTFIMEENYAHAGIMRSDEADKLLYDFNYNAYSLYDEYGGNVPEAEIDAIYGRYDREAMSELNTELIGTVLDVFNSVEGQ